MTKLQETLSLTSKLKQKLKLKLFVSELQPNEKELIKSIVKDLENILIVGNS